MSGDMHRTEHAGGKNGGGYWGPRAHAKAKSKKVRRRRDMRASTVPDGWTWTTKSTLPEPHK